MGILKRAPEVTIRAPRAVYVGRRCVVDVVIDARDDLEVEYIEARVDGEQGWAIGAGKSRVSEQATFPSLVTRIMEAGTLSAGVTERSATFLLPPGTPPSHELSPAWARLVLSVRVAIPWWPDGRYRFAVPVRLPPPPVEHRPCIVRSTPADAAPDARRLELSLASRTFIAGERVTGSLAVYHLDDRKPREVELILVPRLDLLGRRTRERDADGFAVTFTLPAGSAGTDLPFGFTLPPTIAPGFQTLTHRLRWVLVARSGSFFGGKVELAVPVEIVDAAAAEAAPQPAAAPRLADKRIGEVLDAFAAAHGWQRVGDAAIERVAGDALLRITHSYRGETGTFLTSTVEFSSLGLELAVTPSSPIRHMFFEDIEVDVAEWDRRHHVVARSAEQAVSMLRLAVPALQQASALGTMVRWNDDAIVFERAIAGLDPTELAPIADTLAFTAAALAVAASAIEPPRGVTLDLSAWQELARGLDGRLGLGDLSIDGTLAGSPVSLGLEWHDGNPRGFRVSVGDPQRAGTDLRAISFTLATPSADALSQPAAEPLVEQLVAWPRDVVELRVHDGVASALLLLTDGTRPFADASRVRALADSLGATLAALAPSGGPYR